MATSTLPGVILALLEKFNGLTYPKMLGEPSPVYVLDGIPGPDAPDHYLSVGGDGRPAGEISQRYQNLGGTRRDEDVTVHCLASSYVAGAAAPADYSVASDAQRNARTNAFAIVGAIETALRSDKNLTNVTDAPGIYWCEAVTVGELEQSADDDVESDKGRTATVRFDIHARAQI
jgi:hypothetical protein